MTIILFGASGFTGTLTASALAERLQAVAASGDPVPDVVLAGRSRERLEAVLASSGLAAEALDADVAVADAADEASVAALVGAEDTLLTTVGPFLRHGRPAARAAAATGARYLDSTGEPPFVRWLQDELHEQARSSGAQLLPAFGYDYVPGHLAAGLALAEAPEALGIRIGYFGFGGGVSRGTMASAAGVLVAPGFRWHGGRLEPDNGGARAAAFPVDGTTLNGLSIAGSEHLFLPRTHPQLADVDVYLGWLLGRYAPLLARTSPLLTAALQLPGARDLIEAGVAALVDRLPVPDGPSAEERVSARCVVLAQALDDAGDVLHEVAVTGPDPYELTAALLAEAALAPRDVPGQDPVTGVVGPLEAFGLPGLTALAARCGLAR